MRRGKWGGRDVTSETAIGDVSGDSLLTEVFSRIPDQEDRALLLAHVALGVSLTSLERQLEVSREDLAARIDSTLEVLRADAELADVLSGIRRAGRMEHDRALIIRLGLQDWFCAYCMQFMIQPTTGRPRRTCSDLCRHRLWRRQAREVSLRRNSITA
jgi:hypothetical protein